MCSNILEHIIFSHIMDHYDDNTILNPAQHGFRPGHSCQTQLLVTVNDLALAIDHCKQVDAIILDFSKAFDKVSHKKLISKLNHYGIRKNLLHWLQTFSTNSSQRVVVDGEASDWCHVSSGIPQGIVIGPLLFLTFINDLPDSIQSNIHLFADDCLIYRSISKAEDQTILQRDLNSLKSWADKWNIQFNVEKCHSMTIIIPAP